VAAVRNSGRIIQRKDLESLLPKMGSSTLTRHLTDAVKLGELLRPTTGHYCAPGYDQMPGTIDIEQMSDQKEEDHSEVLN
jgi:hypothetical protein